MPAFSSPTDCTPWVIGGVWPAELAAVTDETAPLAGYLEKDLQRIVSSANKQLGMVKRAGLTQEGRQAAETRIVEEARARAVRRVESTMRQLDLMKTQLHARRRSASPESRDSGVDLEKTQIIPTVPLPPPAAPDRALEETQVIPVVPTQPEVARPADDRTDVIVTGQPAPDESTTVEKPITETVGGDDKRDASAGRHRAPSRAETKVVSIPPQPAPEPQPEPEPEPVAAAEPVVDVLAEDHDDAGADEGRHRTTGEDAAGPVVSEPEAEPEPVPEPEAQAEPEAEAEPAPVAEPEPEATETETEKLQRLLAFVVRQEPRLNWAVGALADGTTLLVTDLAHGWIPPLIELPQGVRLLPPGRRAGRASALLGDARLTATYTPGDPVGRPGDFAETQPSVAPRDLPAVQDLGWELSRLTHWRDGLPRLVHTLAKAASAGTGVVEEEADLLRVHLDTARYQLLSQYPDVDSALLLNCLLLAATDSSVAGDAVSANYHLAWFQKLDEPPTSRWAADT